MSAGLALLLVLQAQTPSYGDTATAALIARARERHRQQDAAVRDYRATLRTRLDVSVGRGRFSRILPVGMQEQEAELHWQAPNDLRIVALGRRSRSAYPNIEVGVSWTRPWFVPRFLGDSIRLLGSRGFPRRAAVHPLAAGAQDLYQYAITDSMELALPGRVVRALRVRVTPTRAEEALIAGELWLDGETAETVRLSFVFVGRRLWAEPAESAEPDSARARRTSGLAERIVRVSADLEYGLYEQRYWLPYRQAVTLDVEMPWVKNLVVPVRFITTFRGIMVNQGGALGFVVAPGDSTRVRRCAQGVVMGATGRLGPIGAPQGCLTAGVWSEGRYEIEMPPDSALLNYQGWNDSLTLELSDVDAERIEAVRHDVARTLAELPGEFTARRRLQLAFDDLQDITRFNRAEGTALGAGLEWRLGPPFVSAIAKLRYAFTDRRLQGSLALRRERPGLRAELAIFREMRDVDPLAPGLTLSNSFSATWLARDDGDYVFAQGAEMGYQRPWGHADLALKLRLARESAPPRTAHSGLNDLLGGTGEFRSQAPVAGGTFLTLTAEAIGGSLAGTWTAGTQLSAGTLWHARAWLSRVVRARLALGFDLTAFGWMGAGLGDSLPQADFRLGGAKTLRGYPAGSFRGPAAWSLGADLAMSGWALSPVIFADVGQVTARSLALRGRSRASVGVGLSFLGGAVRFNAARPISPRATWLFDLTLNALR